MEDDLKPAGYLCWYSLHFCVISSSSDPMLVSTFSSSGRFSRFYNLFACGCLSRLCKRLGSVYSSSVCPSAQMDVRRSAGFLSILPISHDLVGFWGCWSRSLAVLCRKLKGRVVHLQRWCGCKTWKWCCWLETELFHGRLSFCHWCRTCSRPC